MNQTKIKRKPFSIQWNSVFIVVMLAAGLCLRFLNLTNPPLDFHASRQLNSAIVARGMYYQMLPGADPVQRETAINIWKSLEVYEPPILERIVALSYLVVGSEQLWIARIYSSIFWLIGGLALFGLARRMTSTAGGWAALIFYLFVPFGVIASRSFQPDPFMVMWILIALYSFYRWSEKQTWKWALMTGVFVGIAVLIKVFAAVLLAPALVMLVLSTVGLRTLVRNKQVLSMAGISIIIPTLYYIFSIGTRSSGFFNFWVSSYTYMLIQPRFYFAWLGIAGSLVGISTILLSLAGFMLISGKGKVLILGLWLGYGLFGLLLPVHISTHDYYSLALIPIIALSLAAPISLLVEKIIKQPLFWQGLAAAVVILAVSISAWLARNGIVSENYASEARGWTKLGTQMPRDGSIIALTHDYGYRLEYYGWIDIDIWPYLADINLEALRSSSGTEGQLDGNTFDQYFAKMIQGHKYFLVTLFSELDAQPLLKTKLSNTYPVYQKGDGFILYDLSHPLALSLQP